MKAKLVVNPVSGVDAASDYLPLINTRLRELVGELDIVMTVAEGDATRAACAAVRDGYDHVFAGGGDGTLNEVLNGVAEAGGLDRVTLGVVPLGTGNDFATAIGFPSDIEEALDALVHARAVAVDVGRLNGRYFINVSGGGFIAEVSDAVNPQLKTIAGKLAYLLGGAQVLLNHEPMMVSVSMTGEGERTAPALDALRIHAFAVCNSPLIGGGRLIAPNAKLDDGLLDVCLIEAMSTVDFVTLLASVSNGEHLEDPRVRYFTATELTLDFDAPVKVNTDGQVLEAARCEYRVLPGAARVLVPRARPD